MIEDDTIKLLRECDAGIKMGMDAIGNVIDHVHDDTFRKTLADSRSSHQCIQEEIEKLLGRYHDDGKQPAMMASAMSHMKTSAKLMADNTDAAVADVLTDGCNMGIKSLTKYLHKYQAADEQTKDITKRLIALEEDLLHDMSEYL